MRRTRYPAIEPRVVSDDTTLTYHLRDWNSAEKRLVVACGTDVIGVLEPVTHAATRGLTVCPDCAR